LADFVLAAQVMLEFSIAVRLFPFLRREAATNARFLTRSVSTVFFVSVFDELAQPAKGGVPLLCNQVEVPTRVFKAPLVQLPNALTAVPSATHDTRSLHHTQVFGDRLTSDVGARGKPGDGHRSLITEAGDKPQAGLVTERRKKERRALQLYAWVKIPGQGTPR
jgi:hypothetical protein